MSCKNYKNLIMDLIFDEIQDKTKKDVLDHLKACPSCTTEYEELLITRKLVSESQQKLQISPRTAVEIQNIPAPEPWGKHLLRKSWPWAMAAVFLLLAILIGRPSISMGKKGFTLAFGTMESDPKTENIVTEDQLQLYRVETLQMIAGMIADNNEKQRQENLKTMAAMSQDFNRRRQQDLQLVDYGFQKVQKDSREDLLKTGMLINDYLSKTQTRGNKIEGYQK
ncbi:MAG: zf-HC2 domain-containing protein [FCB group bacterium]|nr:zf-HC2 domain-containing protein [FCB group bacterium]